MMADRRRRAKVSLTQPYLSNAPLTLLAMRQSIIDINKIVKWQILDDGVLNQDAAERERLCRILVTIFASGIVAAFDDAIAPEFLKRCAKFTVAAPGPACSAGSHEVHIASEMDISPWAKIRNWISLNVFVQPIRAMPRERCAHNTGCYLCPRSRCVGALNDRDDPDVTKPRPFTSGHCICLPGARGMVRLQVSMETANEHAALRAAEEQQQIPPPTFESLQTTTTNTWWHA